MSDSSSEVSPGAQGSARIADAQSGNAPHQFVQEWSAESPYCGAMVMRNGGGDTCGQRRGEAIHIHVGHTLSCLTRRRPPEDYELGNPDSEQHCDQCHCSCNGDGPRCGHWVGCPGC